MNYTEQQNESDNNLSSQNSLSALLDDLDSDAIEHVLNKRELLSPAFAADPMISGVTRHANMSFQSTSSQMPSPAAFDVQHCSIQPTPPPYATPAMIPTPVQQCYSDSNTTVIHASTQASAFEYSSINSPAAGHSPAASFSSLPSPSTPTDAFTALTSRPTTEGVFEGRHSFNLCFPAKTKVTKSTPWVYSKKLNKLYAKMDTQCPVTFKVSSQVPGLCVKATPFFTDQESRDLAVHACHVHTDPTKKSLYCSSFTPWMLTAACYNARTTEDYRGNFSLLVPWSVAESSMELTYSFACRNTCIGGPNRKSTSVAFTLENERGEVLGKQVVEVKVVSSPGRDKEKEEKKEHEKKADLAIKPDTPTSVVVKQKVRKVSFLDEQPPRKKYYLEMNERLTYETLAPLRDSLDIMYSMPSEQIAKFKQENTKKSALKIRCPNTQHLSHHHLPATEIAPQDINSPCQVPDSTADEDMKISSWLKTFDFECYSDTFSSAGYVNMGQILHFTTKHLSALRLVTSHIRIILNQLAKYRDEAPLSQPSASGEAFGLLMYSAIKHAIASSSSSED